MLLTWAGAGVGPAVLTRFGAISKTSRRTGRRKRREGAAAGRNQIKGHRTRKGHAVVKWKRSQGQEKKQQSQVPTLVMG